MSLTLSYVDPIVGPNTVTFHTDEELQVWWDLYQTRVIRRQTEQVEAVLAAMQAPQAGERAA